MYSKETSETSELSKTSEWPKKIKFQFEGKVYLYEGPNKPGTDIDHFMRIIGIGRLIPGINRSSIQDYQLVFGDKVYPNDTTLEEIGNKTTLDNLSIQVEKNILGLTKDNLKAKIMKHAPVKWKVGDENLEYWQIRDENITEFKTEEFKTKEEFEEFKKALFKEVPGLNNLIKLSFKEVNEYLGPGFYRSYFSATISINNEQMKNEIALCLLVTDGLEAEAQNKKADKLAKAQIAKVDFSAGTMAIKFSNESYGMQALEAFKETKYASDNAQLTQSDDDPHGYKYKIEITDLNQVKRLLEKIGGYSEEYTKNLFKVNGIKLKPDFFIKELEAIGQTQDNLRAKKDKATSFINNFLPLLEESKGQELKTQIEKAGNSSLLYLRENTGATRKVFKYGSTNTYTGILEKIDNFIAQNKPALIEVEAKKEPKQQQTDSTRLMLQQQQTQRKVEAQERPRQQQDDPTKLTLQQTQRKSEVQKEPAQRQQQVTQPKATGFGDFFLWGVKVVKTTLTQTNQRQANVDDNLPDDPREEHTSGL